MKRKTVKRSELSLAKMAAGNERRYPRVLDNGVVKEWVGIGWISIGSTTDAEKAKIPEVVE